METLTSDAPAERNGRSTTPSAAVSAAEHDLLHHLAMMGELLDRHDQLRTEVAGLAQLLVQARQRKATLIARVLELGGQLPSWEMC